MAESDKIKSDDLIQKDVFDNTTKSAIALKEELSHLVVGFEGIIKANAEFLKLNKNGVDSKTIREQAKAVQEVEKATFLLTKTKLESAKVSQQLIKNGTEQIRQDRELSKNSAQKQKDLDREIKLQQQQNSEYKKQSDALRDVKAQIKDLVVAGTPVSEELAKRFRELDGAVRLADAKVGEFGRNVGNYQGKFNGLGNSVNQLTREMPAFANSIQTGFMAISNNLPIFFDEIKRTNDELKAMQAEGKKAPSLFSAIANSIFSWGTALSIGVTLLTVFGKQIVEFISSLGKSDEALKLSTQTQSDYYKKLKQIIDQRIEDQIRLNIATGAWTEERAEQFRKERTINEATVAADRWFYNERVRNAKEFKIKLEQFSGSLPETAQQLNPNKPLTEKEINEITARNKDLFERNRQINKAYVDLNNMRLTEIEKQTEAAETEAAANQAERDQAEFEKRLKEAKNNADKKHKLQMEWSEAQAKKMYDEIERQEKKLSDLIKKYEKERDEDLKNRADETIWWDKENGITMEEHNQTVDDIEKAREKAKQDKIKETQFAINESQRVLQATQQVLDTENKLREDALNRQLDQHEKASNRQLELAKSGLKNQLAFEDKEIAKDQLQKKELAKKEAREREAIQLSQAYLNAYNAELTKVGANPSSAAALALKDVLIAKGIANGIAALASFYDGTEDTGTVNQPLDKNGGRLAILHDNERIVNAKGNKKIKDSAKGKTIDNDKLVDIAVKYNTGQLVDISPRFNLERTSSFADNVANSILVNELTRNTQLLEKIANKPVQQVSVDALGNLIETMYYNGRKDVIVHKSKTRL